MQRPSCYPFCPAPLLCPLSECMQTFDASCLAEWCRAMGLPTHDTSRSPRAPPRDSTFTLSLPPSHNTDVLRHLCRLRLLRHAVRIRGAPLGTTVRAISTPPREGSVGFLASKHPVPVVELCKNSWIIVLFRREKLCIVNRSARGLL